jgi:hypothetical protein
MVEQDHASALDMDAIVRHRRTLGVQRGTSHCNVLWHLPVILSTPTCVRVSYEAQIPGFRILNLPQAIGCSMGYAVLIASSHLAQGLISCTSHSSLFATPCT